MTITLTLVKLRHGRKVIYPSLTIIDDEEDEQKEKLAKCMMRHNSKFRLRWDLIVIFFALYNCVSIPYEVAFSGGFSDHISMTILDYIIDVCFFMDIVFNFRTTYVNSKTGTEVISPKKVFINYAFHGRFFIDLLASIPFELIVEFILPNNSFSFQLFGLLKLIRLLRLGRIITYMKFKQGLKIGFRIFQLLFFLLLLVHWIGCIWYMLVSAEDSWVPPKDLDSGITNFYRINSFRQYTVVFYYAILLIVGNESAPKTTEQTIFSSLVVIMGAIVTAFIFGNMAALMATINKKDSHFQEQLDFVTTTMRSIKLPEEIQNQVIEYLMHCQESPDVQQDIEKFFDILSPSLKNSILQHMYNKIIQEIDIFHDCTAIEVGFIVNNLKTMLFLIDDEIIRQGDFGNRMYFISSGTVDVFLTVEKYQKEVKNNQNRDQPDIDSNSDFSEEDKALKRTETRINRLNSGRYFGEIALVTNLKRTTTVKAIDYTTLAYLTRENFNDIKKEFPQVYLNFKYNIKKYTDSDFEFRRSMIRNTPYFRNLEDDIIDEIVYLLRPNRYDPGTTIIKYGDITSKIHYLKQGEIDVTIPTKSGITQTETHFETLNAGSCFCAFSSFSDDVQQLVNFKAKTSCIVETIEVKDLEFIERTYLQLSDEIKKLKLLIDNKDKSELDFFRYLKPLKKEHKANVKAQVRRKFRAAVKKFTRKYKEDKNCLPNALIALQDIMKERRRKQREILHLQRINTIKYLQEKSPLIHPNQDLGSGDVNLFINQTIQNQYNVHNLNIQPQFSGGSLAPSNGAYKPSINQGYGKEQEELEMLRKMDEEARKEKIKTNQNLTKLLNLIEVHNSTLEEIESKFKKEFLDIKTNIKKIKLYQREQERLRAENQVAKRLETSGPKKDANSSLSDSLLGIKEDHKVSKAPSTAIVPVQIPHRASEKASKHPKSSEKPPQKLENPIKPKESNTALEHLYPRIESPVEQQLDESMEKAENIGILIGSQNLSKAPPVPKDQFETRDPMEDQRKKVIKKKSSVSKDMSLKAPREAKPEPSYATPPVLIAEKKKELQPIIIEESKMSPKPLEVETPALQKLESDSQMIDGNIYHDKEIELTDEDDFPQDLEKIQSPDSDPSEESDGSEESEEDRELSPDIGNKLIADEHPKKLSEVSFEESSLEEDNNDEDDNKVAYEEHMPRLNEDVGVAEETKKSKKKKKKIKFKKSARPNHQDMDVMMREQLNKKDKAKEAKNSKKSYHAYLEHPRMKHQPSLTSIKGKPKGEELDPLGLAPRPKKK